MTMTVVVTRNVAPRFRGFLASVMLEIAPGVYTAPRMTKAVRERVWAALGEWFDAGATVGGALSSHKSPPPWPSSSKGTMGKPSRATASASHCLDELAELGTISTGDFSGHMKLFNGMVSMTDTIPQVQREDSGRGLVLMVPIT